MARLPETRIQHTWLWQWRLPDVLETTDGSVVKVIHPGWLRYAPGPDFRKARIIMDGQLYQGDIEIHVDSRDWFRHGHAEDEAYQNVILHVVLTASVPVFTRDRRPIPQVALEQYLNLQDLEQLAGIVIDYRPRGPRCTAYLLNREPAEIHHILNRMGISYLLHRAQRIQEEIPDPDPCQRLHQKLMRALGYGGYATFFEGLAQRYPWPVFRHRAAQEPTRFYTELMSDLQVFLQHPKPQKEPGFHHGRPANHPGIRLAWYVAFIHTARRPDLLADLHRMARMCLDRQPDRSTFRELWTTWVQRVRSVPWRSLTNDPIARFNPAAVGTRRWTTLWWNAVVPVTMLDRTPLTLDLDTCRSMQTGPIEDDWIQRTLIRQFGFMGDLIDRNDPLIQLGLHGLFRLVCNDLRITCLHCPLKPSSFTV